MGRAARWFRNFLGLKKPSDSLSTALPPSAPVKDKRRWSFVRSHREPPPIPVDGAADRLSENDRAAVGGLRGREVMAVAGTVRLRKRELDGEDAAAVVIQSAFRGYLARRALRALKGLVKIQALVRGYIVRKKRTAEWLCQMQALLRAQARARADRALISASSQSTSKCLLFAQHPGPSTPEKLEPLFQMKSSILDQSPVLRKSGSSSEIGRNWFDRNVDRRVWDQGGPSTGIGCSGDCDRGNEIPVTCENTRNSGRIAQTSRHLRSASRSFTAWKDSLYCEAQSAYPVGFLTDEAELCTANSSPQIFSAASKSPNMRRSPFTPSKSDNTRSYFCGYSDYPNYMSYTESSWAKVRSASTPRQRPHFEMSGSLKRNSMHGFGESRSASHKSSLAMFTNFASKAYPGSGRLDCRGMPIRVNGLGYRCLD